MVFLRFSEYSLRENKVNNHWLQKLGHSPLILDISWKLFSSDQKLNVVSTYYFPHF